MIQRKSDMSHLRLIYNFKMKRIDIFQQKKERCFLQLSSFLLVPSKKKLFSLLLSLSLCLSVKEENRRNFN